LARLRAAAWAVVFLVLVLYAGRAWFRLIRKTAADVSAALRDGLPPALHDAGQAAVTILVCAASLILAMAVIRGRRADRLSVGGDFSAGILLLVLTGIAMLLVLLVTAVLHQPVPGLLLLAMAGAAGLAGAVSFRAGSGRETGRADPVDTADVPATRETSAPAERRWVFRLVSVASVAPLALLAWALVRDAAWLGLYRPAATGDEANFWWNATERLHQLGFHEYLSSFAVAGYLPGYPLFANLLLGWIPDPLFAAAGRAVPFLLGVACLWILLRTSVTRRTVISPTAGLFYVLAYVLSEALGWVHELLFQLWYGESFAIAAFALILVLVDRARRMTAGGSASTIPALAMFGTGLAVLAALSKPPLSFLLVPAILPALAIFGLALRRRGDAVRPFALTLVAMAIAGFAAQALWGVLLRAYGLTTYYSVDLTGLLAFRPEGSFAQLGPYFLANYEPVWVIFLLTSALALLHDWRRFLPFWLVSMGMIASIFVLYLGVWSDVEYESGARYILHGAYGWTLFALAAMAPAILATLERWIAWIGDALAWGPRRLRTAAA